MSRLGRALSSFRSFVWRFSATLLMMAIVVGGVSLAQAVDGRGHLVTWATGLLVGAVIASWAKGSENDEQGGNG
jgi:hypothetical protein